MTIEVFGHKMDREVAEAIAEAIIEACNRDDGDENCEASEVDEDDFRAFPTELPEGWTEPEEE